MKKFLRNFADYAVYLLVRVVICVAQCFSLDVCRRGAEVLAFLFTDVLKARGRLLETNLSKAFPESTKKERREEIRRMWTHLFLMAAEVAHAPRELHELNWWKSVIWKTRIGC